jgi:chromosome segregation protein
MRLSKLHISGFKSFPDRAELAFDDGVTAIVGPNGCGKSNVVDAITWVLGEQSAKSLRGERMEDVIFAGSDARKPTAAAEVRLMLSEVAQAMEQGRRQKAEGRNGSQEVGNEPGADAASSETDTDAAASETDAAAAQDAEVAATVKQTAQELEALLDDGPISVRDVEIGRRLYRSGESEYLIDGEVCRLRDIHDLLMDSGLGVKAYAVIEQGKIGQILSSRPAERRALIEEAAGVTKYKSRRRAAELKLEAAQQNLTRVDDIIYEVEKQRGTLKRQAAKARRYQKLREELRRWEQVQFAHRFRTLSRDIETADARLSAAREREAVASSNLASIETTIEGLRINLTETEARSTSTREQAHGRELEIGRRQQQIAFDRQQIADLGVRGEELALEVRDLEGRQEPAEREIAAQRAAAESIRAGIADAAAVVTSREEDYARAQMGTQDVEREADELRAQVMSAATTLSALRQARDNAGAVKDRVASELGRLAIEARELSAEADRVRAQREQAAQALTAARDAVAAAAAERGAVDAELSGLRARRQQVVAELAARQREQAGLTARLSSLESLDASRASFGDAARFLLAEAPEAVGQHGAIADHIEVERSFERAVDALLGDLLQHVIVGSSDQVTAALRLLGEKDAGRCGFLVLDGAGGHTPTVDAPAGTRALHTVVRVTGPYAAAISHVLGDALIADDFDTARRVASTVNVPVATPDGDVFHGSWLVEGGARKDARGILELRSEIAALRADVERVRQAAHELGNDQTGLDFQINDAEARLAAAIAAVHTHEKAIVGHEAQSVRSEDELSRVSRRLEVVLTEQRRAEEEERTAAGRRDEATTAISEHEAGYKAAEERLGDVLARLQGARDAAEQCLRLVTEARTQQATMVERAAALDADVARLTAAFDELLQRIDGRKSEIERTHARRAELGQNIVDTERWLDEDVRVLEALRVDMREIDELLVGLRAEFEGREHEVRAARQVLEAVRGEVMQGEVAKARAASDLEHLNQQCVDAVNAPLEAVIVEVERMEAAGELKAPKKFRDEDEDGAAAADDGADVVSDGSPLAADGSDVGAEGSEIESGGVVDPEAVIADFRGRIERLGPVNMMAIGQFDELEQRHTFLTTQRKDLLDSIAQTGEAIKRIDKTTKERFEEAFHSINEKFQVMFATVFGGGRAGLVLIDQENDEDSGIDIIAQPPGKRLQNVQLLSGGEKALTAMALMFAIFKYRPSPFCLLDEIDAPLDDANIGRFVDMLKMMQDHTQFILITHNRKTMEIANRLYGVTMEEPGVSKLISLQMN